VIDLHKLRHFVVLARTGSFVKAAEQLHLSQPALSRSIQSLERQHHVALFDRSRSGVFLTAIGRQMLARAEDLIFNANSLEHSLGGAAAGVSGFVSFGIGPNAGSVILPSLLRSVLRDYPQIRVRVVTEPVATMVQQLVDSEIEFFIGRHDPVYTPERVRVEPLWMAGPSYLVRRGHPLLDLDSVPLEALQAYPRLAPTAWNETFAHTVPEEARGWICSTLEMDNFELLADVAIDTDAVLISYLWNRREGLVHLRMRPSTSAPRDAVVGLFTMKARSLSPASSAVMAILLDVARRTVGAAPDIESASHA